ncbi:MAG TPA: TonB-dependent receptor [Gammaproteobacteria bacterium]|jgi:iron complex outermembrane receptor protein|nr:TonB-dependent receptor [Gammaproteobacteria bacterium]
MSKQNLVSKAVRFALVCGAATGFAGKAFAADDTAATTTAATDANTAQLGKIEVTGTKIKRTDVEQAQPVNIITQQQIKATGITTIGQLIQKLPSSGAALNTLANFGGNFQFTGGGESNVDLRNLGASRVLVLVNGKRWATSLVGTVDLNTVPTSIIDHVEVLQDGASAIYGSDAIAGVVNIVTVKDYNSREANAYLGIYNGDGHYDGRTQAYDFTMGGSNDKSGLVFNVSYTNQEAIPSAHRNISKEPVVGAGAASGSSAIPNGRFVIIAPGTSNGNDPGNVVDPTTGLTQAQCPTTNLGTSTAPNYQPFCNLTLIHGVSGKPSLSDFRPFISGGPTSDRFNYAPYNFVLTPEERYSTYFQGYTDLADNLTFKADMMYSHRDSRQQAAPEPLFFASSSIAIDIPANQAYNPFGFDLNTDTNLGLLGRRMLETGNRLYHEKGDMFRFSGGFNGYFNMGGGEWDWDLGYIFSKESEIDTNQGHFDVSHLRLALGDPATCAATIGCVPLNLFGGQGGITQSMLDYVSYTTQNQFENNERIYNADISNGSLFEMPGGSAGLAVGVESLEHDGFFNPDSVAQNGYDSFNPGRPVAATSGRTSERSLYTELDLPLVSDVSGIKLLDLDLAGRHTNYDTFGSNNTYRWGLKYQPNGDWLIRTSWSQGFRAPSINDLFSGNTNLSANITDPCSGPVSGRPASCVGVPASYVQPNAQINTLEGGNPNLQPETSVSRTLGFVYSPEGLTGFNLSMDYYKIDVNDTINPISGQAIFDGCYFGGDQSLCNRIIRTSFGTVKTVQDSVTNVGTTSTSGIDVAVNYAFPSTGIGDFKLSIDETHIKSYDLNGLELAGFERGGTVFPFGVPKDKLRASLDWSAGAWSAQYGLRVIGHMTEVPTNNHIGTTVYHDVQVAYGVDSIGTTFTFGVRNLWAKEPPLSTVQELNSFDPTLYDVPGRFLYVRAGVKF